MVYTLSALLSAHPHGRQAQEHMALIVERSLKNADSPQESAADQDMRCVIDADGHIRYASASFGQLVTQDAHALRGQHLTAILEFAEPDEAIRERSLFGRNSGAYIDALREGRHRIILHGPKGLLHTRFLQFDFVTLAKDRRYVLISDVTDQDDRLPAVMDDALKNILEDVNVVSGPPVADKISGLSAEGELRHFLNMSNDLMAIAGSDGVLVRVNHTFNGALGYSDDELRRMTFLDLIHRDDRPHVRQCLAGIMHAEDDPEMTVDFEARVVGKQGHVLWTEWRQKREDGMIYSVGRNVSAIKEQEAALRQQQQQLNEAQAIGRMGHWHWAVGSEDIHMSDEIYRIFGQSRQGFVPTLENINALLHRRDLGRLLQAFQRAIIEQNNYDMDFRIARPNGETRYIHCEGKCEIDEQGEVTALFGIMQDITERTLHERDLQEAKEAAERAYAAKSQFLANMSHELRTPLNAIIGFSEMMQRQLLGPIGTEKYLDYIAGIRESGEHLLDLISDILDMSKIEAGKYELDLENLNLSKIIKLAVHMMEGRAQESRIKITADVVNPDLHIVADRRALMQILLNLLSNAVKFTEPGGQVKVECRERENAVLIKVQDNGIGIPANKIHCITHPFEQAASHYTREHEGTGLGLAITKDLIELHAGALHIESTVGVGTIVTVRLPLNAHEPVKSTREN